MCTMIQTGGCSLMVNGGLMKRSRMRAARAVAVSAEAMGLRPLMERVLSRRETLKA